MRTGVCRKVIVFLSAVCFSVSAGEKNSLRVKIPLSEQRKTFRVEADFSNIRREKLPAHEELPAGKGFAALFGRIPERVFWTPAMNDAGSGTKLRIRDAAQSVDHTVLVFLEETGKEPGGPFGGRIIVCDIPGQKILRVIESDRRLDRIALASSSGKLLASALPEKRMPGQEQGGIALFDLVKGKEISFISGLNCDDLSASDDAVFLHSANSKKLDRRSFSGELQKTLTFPEKAEHLVFSGGVIAASSGGKIIFYDVSSMKKTSELALPLPEETVSGLFPLSGDGSLFAVFASLSEKGRGNLYLIRKNTLRRIASDATGLCVPCGKKALVYSRVRKRQISRILLESGRETASAVPQSTRPQTYGLTKYLFPGCEEDEVFLMDTTGSLSIFKAVRYRWRKKLFEGIVR